MPYDSFKLTNNTESTFSLVKSSYKITNEFTKAIEDIFSIDIDSIFMQGNLSFTDGSDSDSELGQLDTFENDIQKVFKPLRRNEYCIDIKSSFENTNKSLNYKTIFFLQFNKSK